MTTSPAYCPQCGARVSGRFCAACGASLSSGGTPASQPWLAPWQITAILGAIAILTVVWAFTRPPSAVPVAAAPSNAPGSPPDLSTMTPHDQFIRLSDRVETAMEGGDTTTVSRFFPMVEGAFSNMSVAERDIDSRFHMALLRAQVGEFAGAIAQIDTIRASVPTHLFADYLSALIGDIRHDSVASRAARLAFRKHFDPELAANRPEYEAHRALLDDFLKSTPVK